MKLFHTCATNVDLNICFFLIVLEYNSSVFRYSSFDPGTRSRRHRLLGLLQRRTCSWTGTNFGSSCVQQSGGWWHMNHQAKLSIRVSFSFYLKLAEAYHNEMLPIKEVGRVTWVELRSDEPLIPVERRVGPLPHTTIVTVDDVSGVVDVCVGRADGVLISNAFDDKGSCGWTHGTGCQFLTPTLFTAPFTLGPSSLSHSFLNSASVGNLPPFHFAKSSNSSLLAIKGQLPPTSKPTGP